MFISEERRVLVNTLCLLIMLIKYDN